MTSFSKRYTCVSRMLKKSASGVLAFLRDSTYRSVRIVSSRAAALLDGHFEHPGEMFLYGTHVQASEFLVRQPSFSAAC